MSLYIHGCFFTESSVPAEQFNKMVATLSRSCDLKLVALQAEDSEVLDDLLRSRGIFPSRMRHFAIAGASGGPDATDLWLQAYSSRLSADGSKSSSLHQWIEGLSRLQGKGIGVAIAAFDGSIDIVSEYRLASGIHHLLETLSKPWTSLDNELAILTP